MSTGSDGPRTNGELSSSAPPASSSQPKLDVSKLHSLPSEQQDLYLFTFVVDLEKYVSSLSVEELTAQQTSVNEEAFQIVNLKSPAPSKAIRNNLGRILARVLGKGNRRTLFDSINQLLFIINAGKGEKELYNKHAAVYCLGEVYGAAGDSALNLSGLACSSLLRLLKPAREHVGLRAAIFHALSKVAIGIGKQLDEAIARDIWKQSRKAAGDDKAALTQARACGTLETLVTTTRYFDSTSHFEELRMAIWKAAETPVSATRQAIASCLAAFLVKAFSGDISSRQISKPKKKRAAIPNPDEALENGASEASRPTSPTGPTKKQPEKVSLSLSDILRYLSTRYTLPSTSNKMRAMLVHAYCKVLTSLGSVDVEAASFRIIDHLFTDLLSNHFISHDRHRLLLTRKFIQSILVNCVALKILGESGRLNMARTIINNVLKNFPQVVKEIPQPSKHTLVGALDALASLISSVGSAFRPLADSCREAVIQILQHPSYTVQIYAAHCLRSLVQTCPQQILSCASICMNSVVRELGVLASGNGGKIAHRRCIGYANGLAAIISVSPSQPLYGSLEISSRVLKIATDLLKSSSQADLWIADTQVQVAWILIGGLMALGPNFVKTHLSQFLLLWKNSLPKPLRRDNTKPRQSSELHYLTSIRECTLGSILSFLEFNGRLLTTDVSRRLATMLQNTVEYLDSLPTKKPLEEHPQGKISSLSIQDLILMVRRRVLQCFYKLLIYSPHVGTEIISHSTLLTSAVTNLADPESYTPGSLSSSIANTSGTFESIWDVADNSGFGITGFANSNSIKTLPGEESIPSSDPTIEDGDGIDRQVRIRFKLKGHSLILTACEPYHRCKRARFHVPTYYAVSKLG